ncbi:MAG: metalloregulator ArsR/SmtB family transcription factor [Actinomycetota bacterium]|nr:metalloregulator ArsR/SmtB family transcription factor [Actinomycetota bacterium]
MVLDGGDELWDSAVVMAESVAGSRLLDDVLALTRALADPNRLKIFFALRVTERCVSDLVASQDLAQSLVSHHLTVLLRAGLVQARWADGFKLYALNPAGLAAARALAMQFLDPASVNPHALPGGNADCCR